MKPVPGAPQPVKRSRHAACCLNYGEDRIKVLISGGLDKDDNVLGDTWILDLDSGKWAEVRRLPKYSIHVLQLKSALLHYTLVILGSIMLTFVTLMVPG